MIGLNDKRGNIMISLLFFLMGMAVMIIFIGPMNDFLGIAQQSDNLNCNGYIYNGNTNHTLSYNSSLNSDTLSCISIKLYLPFIFIVFLIGGVSNVLANRVTDYMGIADTGGY